MAPVLDFRVMDSATFPDASLALHVRSYGAEDGTDRHDFAQLVLPLSGAVLLDIEGRQARLDQHGMAVVAPGSWHTQCGSGPNRSLVVDIDSATIARGPWERLLERRFTALDPAARKLVDYMATMNALQPARPGLPDLLRGWVPLLLDTVASGQARAQVRPVSRLSALLAEVQRQPGLPWTAESMARGAGLSASRLHALFRAELDTTPRAWLLEQRIACARDWLAGTNKPIVQVALDAGFSDQSGLTRALRAATGLTPAAYRRQYARHALNDDPMRR